MGGDPNGLVIQKLGKFWPVFDQQSSKFYIAFFIAPNISGNLSHKRVAADYFTSGTLQLYPLLEPKSYSSTSPPTGKISLYLVF